MLTPVILHLKRTFKMTLYFDALLKDTCRERCCVIISSSPLLPHLCRLENGRFICTVVAFSNKKMCEYSGRFGRLIVDVWA